MSLLGHIALCSLGIHCSCVFSLQETAVDRAMASCLVEFIMQNCYHDNRQVLRNNLEVLKTLVEAWKPCIDIPTK